MLRRHPGFTIIELAMVIVVIGILSTIVITSYQGVQVRARDVKLTDAADKVADAIQLFAVNKGHFPIGGWNSTTAIGAGTECADGGAGFMTTGNYTCALEDTLVASGYLPKDFTSNLPQNPLYAGSAQNKAIMVYLGAAARTAMVYYSMEKPSSGDTVNFNAELTKCGYNPAGVVGPRDSYGMKNGICINY